MADLMGYDIGLGEVAGGTQSPLKLLQEFQVEVYLLVSRAIKWPNRCTGLAACRLHRSAEEDQLGVDIILSQLLLKYIVPGCLNIAENQ